MKVKDALIKIKRLREEKDLYKSLGAGYVNHTEFAAMQIIVKNINSELSRLEELVYNMELDDSYDQNTGKINEK